MRLTALMRVAFLLSGPALLGQTTSAPGELVIPLAHGGKNAPGSGTDLQLFDLSYETASGKIPLPKLLTAKWRAQGNVKARARSADGRTITLTSERHGSNYDLRMTAAPNTGIKRWTFSLDCAGGEYLTGLMERLVDGPQQETWKAGRTESLNLRGQSVDMLIRPTLSIYAPFYLSSRGYGLFVKGTWPGHFDFCAKDANKVQVEFEGPSLEMKIYTSKDPGEIVRAHAMDTGPPVLPPKWMYTPWRWRDEHTERAAYYDGTSVTGPFNSEFMEDVLLMKAYGIPNGVYWIDRPWGPGWQGYDDFEIDPNRLPHFVESVEWLNQQGAQMLLWIAPYFQGHMADDALAKDYNMPGQIPSRSNYPLADFTNPEAKQFWVNGVAKLLKLGVVGFKMDRSEENIPDDGPEKLFNGRSLRENRNAYPAEYVQAADKVAKKCGVLGRKRPWESENTKMRGFAHWKRQSS